MSPKYQIGIVVGKVALWGNIIEHEEGFRAQFAYPRSLEEVVCAGCGSITPLDKVVLRSRTPTERAPTRERDSFYTVICPKCPRRDWFRKTSIVRGWQEILSHRYGLHIPLRLRMT